MDTIRTNADRLTRFTSSNIGKLMTLDRDKKSFGAPAKRYIEEKKYETQLGRPLLTDASSHATTWGLLAERFAFNILGVTYKECSQETIINNLLDCHAGSPDGIKVVGEEITVCDIKSPYTIKSFCQLYECKNIEEVRDNHEQGDMYFWQLCSNAILTNAKYAELIVFCPYLNQLDEIRTAATQVDEGYQSKVAWLNYAQDEELPYIIEGGFYKNLHIIRWEVADTDKRALISKIKEADQKLKELLAGKESKNNN